MDTMGRTDEAAELYRKTGQLYEGTENNLRFYSAADVYGRAAELFLKSDKKKDALGLAEDIKEGWGARRPQGNTGKRFPLIEKQETSSKVSARRKRPRPFTKRLRRWRKRLGRNPILPYTLSLSL